MGQCVNLFYLYYINELCTERHCIHNNMSTNIWDKFFWNWSSFLTKTPIGNNMSDSDSLIHQNKSIFNNISDNSLLITEISNSSAIITSKENETGKLLFWLFVQIGFCLFHKNYIIFKMTNMRNIMLPISAFNIYYTSPNIDKWVFHVSSVIMAIIGVVGISSNLGVIGAYIRNKKVRKTS